MMWNNLVPIKVEQFGLGAKKELKIFKRNLQSSEKYNQNNRITPTKIADCYFCSTINKVRNCPNWNKTTQYLNIIWCLELREIKRN